VGRSPIAWRAACCATMPMLRKSAGSLLRAYDGLIACAIRSDFEVGCAHVFRLALDRARSAKRREVRKRSGRTSRRPASRTAENWRFQRISGALRSCAGRAAGKAPAGAAAVGDGWVHVEEVAAMLACRSHGEVAAVRGQKELAEKLQCYGDNTKKR